MNTHAERDTFPCTPSGSVYCLRVLVGGTLLVATCYHHRNGLNMDSKPHRGGPKLNVDRRFDIKFFQQSLIRVTKQTRKHTWFH